MVNSTVQESDQGLIHACRNGDAAAWEQVLNKYERLVFSIPLRYGLDRDAAADIAQITFTILMESLDELREDSHLGGWLATVARRHTWRYLKRSNREAPLENNDLLEIEPLFGDSGGNPIDQFELTEWVDQGLSKIDERCRDLLRALYFDTQQTSYAELAERLHLPLGSIGPTRARCLERLKQILQENQS